MSIVDADALVPDPNLPIISANVYPMQPSHRIGIGFQELKKYWVELNYVWLINILFVIAGQKL
jgi:hypothetical protein